MFRDIASASGPLLGPWGLKKFHILPKHTMGGTPKDSKNKHCSLLRHTLPPVSIAKIRAKS